MGDEFYDLRLTFLLQRCPNDYFNQLIEVQLKKASTL